MTQDFVWFWIIWKGIKHEKPIYNVNDLFTLSLFILSLRLSAYVSKCIISTPSTLVTHNFHNLMNIAKYNHREISWFPSSSLKEIKKTGLINKQ